MIEIRSNISGSNQDPLKILKEFKENSLGSVFFRNTFTKHFESGLHCFIFRFLSSRNRRKVFTVLVFE